MSANRRPGDARFLIHGVPRLAEEQKAQQGDNGASSAPYGSRVRRLVLKYGGNAEAALAAVERENFKLRERARAGQQGQEIQFEPELPEGAVVLSAADAQAWNAFRAIGKTPAEIAESLKQGADASKERDTLKQTVTDHEREKVVHEAAAIESYKPSVLGEQLQRRNASIEIREAEVITNGKTERRKIPHVITGEGKDAQAEPLATYAERELKDYLPALKAEAAAGRETSRTNYPVQQPGGNRVPEADKASQHIADVNRRNAERPNPLRPKVATA